MEEVKETSGNISDKYTKEIELPSRGYLGGPKKVTIRAMTTAEEKILNTIRDNSFAKKICKACTVSPKELDTNKLLPKDLAFMLFQIREVTYGPIYKQPIRCPNCGLAQNAEINIADFEYTFLDEDIDSKLVIELPISKASVSLKLLSQDATEEIEKEVRKLYNEEKISDIDSNIVIRLIANMIVSVSGKEFEDFNQKLSYVNRLHMADYNALRNKLNSIFDSFGLNNTTKVICQNKNCEEKVEVVGTVCPEFFHPTY